MLAGALAVLIVVGAVGLFLGLPVWLLIGAAALPWLVVLRASLGGVVAVASTVLVAIAVFLFALMAGAVVHLPIALMTLLVSIILGLIGCWLVASTRGPGLLRPLLRALPAQSGAALGALGWVLALVLARVRGGASVVSWVMAGDSANNVVFSREMIAARGIQVQAGINVAPLPNGIMAMAADWARFGNVRSLYLTKDLVSFAQSWELFIALTCVLAGLAASALVRPDRRVMRAVIAAAGSLLPLTWVVGGLPIEYGFFNAVVLFPIALCVWMLWARASITPVLSIGLMFVAGTLVLAIWAPLVLFPAGIGVALIVAHRRELLAQRRWPLALLLVAFAQFVLYALLVSVPNFFATGSSLTAIGAVYPFSQWLGLVIALVALGVSLVTLRGAALWGALGAIAGLGAGQGALLYLNRHTGKLWGYYPEKFLWFATLLLMFLLLVLFGKAIGNASRLAWQRVVAVVAVSVGVWAMNNVSQTVPGYVARGPMGWTVFGGLVGPGDTVYADLIKFGSPGKPVILWQSARIGEGETNFWLLQMYSTERKDRLPVADLAYQTDYTKVSDLCTALGVLGPHTVVHTADPKLASELNAQCPEAGGDVSFAG